MKTLPALLIMFSLLLVCGCSKKAAPEAKRAKVDQPQEEQPEEQEIEVATPENPGVTVAGPMAVWEQQAKSAQRERQEARRWEPLPIDHPVYIEPGKPKHFLHNVFSVNKHAQFAFLVPPHQGNARVRGNFRSFTKRNDPNSSDRTADVDLLLLNDQEFNEFLHGQLQSVTYELDSAHNQIVDWRVPTTYGEPQTYHLVFSNSGGAKTKFIEADFTVSFE
jgi:hypothetical protein